MLIQKILIIILLFIQACLFNIPSQCTGNLLTDRSCKWYIDCLEKTFQCGKYGYPISYGYKYCMKFGNYQGFQQVKQWVTKTLKCLKGQLLGSVYLKSYDSNYINCKRLQKVAFDTHPQCYIDGGFCQIWKKLGYKKSLKFLYQLFGIFQIKDFISQKAVKQILIVLKKCTLSN